MSKSTLNQRGNGLEECSSENVENALRNSESSQTICLFRVVDALPLFFIGVGHFSNSPGGS